MCGFGTFGMEFDISSPIFIISCKWEFCDSIEPAEVRFLYSLKIVYTVIKYYELGVNILSRCNCVAKRKTVP